MHNRGISYLHDGANYFRHCYWSPAHLYGYAAGYLARIPRRGYRSTRIWALVYGLTIFERTGGRDFPFASICSYILDEFYFHVWLLPIRLDHYVNSTAGLLTKLMHYGACFMDRNVDLRTFR